MGRCLWNELCQASLDGGMKERKEKWIEIDRHSSCQASWYFHGFESSSHGNSALWTSRNRKDPLSQSISSKERFIHRQWPQSRKRRSFRFLPRRWPPNMSVRVKRWFVRCLKWPTRRRHLSCSLMRLIRY